VPIPGTCSTQRGAENVAAALVTLAPEDLAGVQEILPHGAVGARYWEAMMPSW
jgi:aryl-alcohol dehydrogenase-like predicted oxidoreductase